MKSIWNETVEIFPSETLTRDITVDAAVIGRGMAGILIAYFLQEHGLDAVVLEANCIGSGQTGNTTAKITSQHGLIYDRLIREWGEQRARQYAQANQDAVLAYEKLIRTLGIECEFQKRPAYLYTLSNMEALKREQQAAERLGIPARITEQTTLPFSVQGALQFPDQAMFHPLKFLKAVSEKVTVYEETKVERVEKNQVSTGRHTVKTKYLIFASHFPFINIPGFYFVRMHQERSYVLALEKAGRLDGMYLGIDKDASWSLRNSGNLLLFGGGGHRTGENRSGGKYAALEKEAKSFWPVSRAAARWSAQDCVTIDGIPYIGRFSRSRPDWYVATGFDKWGMTSSMAAARIICDSIKGQVNVYEDVFSPQRRWKLGTVKNLFKETGYAVSGLAKGLFAARPGEYEGEEENRKGPRCAHLGCRLEWNPDEKVWECPCHGSRFTADGSLLDDPAEHSLK